MRGSAKTVGRKRHPPHQSLYCNNALKLGKDVANLRSFATLRRRTEKGPETNCDVMRCQFCRSASGDPGNDGLLSGSARPSEK